MDVVPFVFVDEKYLLGGPMERNVVARTQDSTSRLSGTHGRRLPVKRNYVESGTITGRLKDVTATVFVDAANDHLVATDPSYHTQLPVSQPV
jgi:hypothetical protein